jgi:hypothetical protein
MAERGNARPGIVTALRACGPSGGSVAKGMKKVSYPPGDLLYVRFTLSFLDTVQSTSIRLNGLSLKAGDSFRPSRLIPAMRPPPRAEIFCNHSRPLSRPVSCPMDLREIRPLPTTGSRALASKERDSVAYALTCGLIKRRLRTVPPMLKVSFRRWPGLLQSSIREFSGKFVRWACKSAVAACVKFRHGSHRID